MAAEANARMQMVDGRWELARTSAKDALSGYSAIQASYHSARMELLIGRVERKSGHEVAARKRATHSTTLALRGRFELAWREDDLEFLRWAAESGELEVRRYCREFGVSLEGGTAVLIVDATGVIEAFGKMHELGASSIPFRLARALIAVSPRAITATELCRRLWPTTGLEPRTLNRLKVHLHRLREVLGEENGCVVTELSADRRASGTTYRWNPAVTARILSAGTRNRAGQRG
jgi:hypothetical protein